MKRLAFVAVMLATLLAAACSKGFSSGPGEDGGPTSDPGLTRSAEAGGVAVEGTWLTAKELDGLDADVDAFRLDEFVLVKIQFTTHSGDLNQIEMEKAAVLRQGEADEQPKGWISLSDDSHHRAGVLVFSRGLEGGPAELTIDTGDEELALLWETAPGA
jgi:hypothetical protein